MNKTIDKVSKILDETIQILEREKLNEGFIEALSHSDNSTVKFPINNFTGDTSERITEDFPKDIISSCTDGTENAGLNENCSEVSGQCEQENVSKEELDEHTAISNELNESKNLAAAVDRPTLTDEVEQDTGGEKAVTPNVTDSTDPVVKSAVLVVESEVHVVETAVSVIESVVPVNESEVVIDSSKVAANNSEGVINSPDVVIDKSEISIDSSAVGPVLDSEKTFVSSENLTETDVELNTLHQTHSFGTLLKSDNSSTCLQETSFSLTNNEINQTVTIESNPENLRKIVTEGGFTEPEGLTNTTEQKQLEKIQEFKANQTISVDSLDIDGDTRECSLDSLEMKQPIHHESPTSIDKSLSTTEGDEIFSKKQSPHLSEMFTNVNQTINESTNDLVSEKSSNERLSFDKTNSNERLMRRETFNLPGFVDSNDKSKELLEALPNIINELVEPIYDLSSQDTVSVSSPARSHQGDSELDKQINQMANGKSPIESSVNKEIDTTNSLKRRCTFNIPSVPGATPEFDNLENFETDKSLFQFKEPALPILSPGKRNKEQFEDNNNSNFSEFSFCYFYFILF